MTVLAQIGRLFRVGRQLLEQLSDGTLHPAVPIMLGLFGLLLLGIGVYQIATRKIIITGQDTYRGWSARGYGAFLTVAGTALVIMAMIGQLSRSTAVAQRRQPSRNPPPRMADTDSGRVRNGGQQRRDSVESAPAVERDSKQFVEERSRIDEMREQMAADVPDRAPQPEEPPPPLRLGSPSTPLPPIEYTAAEVRQTAPLGNQRAEDSSEDRAPGQGLLVGMRIALDTRRGDQIIGLQPIYQVADKYELGRQLGSSDGRVEQELAKDGYAVGRIDAHEGFGVDGIRLAFYRVEADGLSSDDLYESPWIGGERGDAKTVGGSGDFVVGLFGAADRELSSLGLLVADQFGRRLGTASTRLPAWKAETPTPVQATDSSDDETFRDMAPEGAALVGMRVAQSDRYGSAVQAIQPIYQLGEEYHVGQWCGAPGGTEQVVLAKPGYVVARINARAGLVMDAVQLQFARVERGRLDADDSYESEWIGGRGGGMRDEPAEPAIIVGISGSAKESIEGLTYYTVPAKAGRARRRPERTERGADAPASAPEDQRTWASKQGGHTVEATLLRVVGPQVVLRNADGKEIRVPIEKLSDADQKYIDEWRNKRRLRR